MELGTFDKYDNFANALGSQNTPETQKLLDLKKNPGISKFSRDFTFDTYTNFVTFDNFDNVLEDIKKIVSQNFNMDLRDASASEN